jgi:hypothetical protein
MRRPGLLLAGVLLATGSSLAIAAPASATGSAPDHRRHCWYQSNGHWFPWHHDWYDDWYDDDGDHWSVGTPSRDDRRRHCYRHRGGGSGGVVIISTGGGRR